jgi:DNA-binding MarR family transcriptional regulator
MPSPVRTETVTAFIAALERVKPEKDDAAVPEAAVRRTATTSGVHSLLALTRANERLGRSISSALGFGLQELSGLIHVAEAGRLTPTDIGRALDVPRPTVTTLIDKLERSGLAVRTRESTDRRKVHVILTEDGEAAMRWAHAQWHEALSVLGEGELPSLIQHLAVLTASVLNQASAVQIRPEDSGTPGHASERHPP